MRRFHARTRLAASSFHARAHAVPAILLRPVERLIGALHQRASGGAVLWKRDYPQTDGDLSVGLRVPTQKGMVLAPPANLLGHDQRSLFGSFGKEHHEFLTAITRHHRTTAQALREDLAQRMQQAVAGHMAVGVVVLFEEVHVHEDQGAGMVVAVRARNLILNSLLEETMVVEAGEPVTAGLVPEELIDVLQILVLLLQRLHEAPVLDREADFLERPARRVRDELKILERLDQVVVGAGAHRRNGVIHRGVTRHDHDLRVAVNPLDLLQELKAVHVAEPDVRDHQGIRLLSEYREGLLPAAHRGDLVPILPQNLGNGPPDTGLIVDDQNPLAAHHTPPLRSVDVFPSTEPPRPRSARHGSVFQVPANEIYASVMRCPFFEQVPTDKTGGSSSTCLSRNYKNVARGVAASAPPEPPTCSAVEIGPPRAAVPGRKMAYGRWRWDERDHRGKRPPAGPWRLLWR